MCEIQQISPPIITFITGYQRPGPALSNPGTLFPWNLSENEKTLPFWGKSKIGMEVDFGNLLKG